MLEFGFDYEEEDPSEVALGGEEGWGVNEAIWRPEGDILPRYRKEDGLLGYWNLDADAWTIEPQYKAGTLFHNGIAAVDISGTETWSFVDVHGNLLEALGTSEVKPVFSSGRIIVRREKLFGIIDGEGNEIYPCKCERIDPFRNDTASVRILAHPDDSESVKLAVDINGNEQNYYVLDDRPDGYSVVIYDGFPALKNPQGKLLYYPHKIYGYAGEGLFIIVDEQTKKLGVADVDGKIIIPMVYKAIGQLGDGLFPVIAENGSFYVDKNNDPVHPALLPDDVVELGTLSNGYAIAVDNNHKYGIVDLDGEVFVPFKYAFIERLNPFLWLAWKFDRNGDYGGDIIEWYDMKAVPCTIKYDRIERPAEGLFMVEKEEKSSGGVSESKFGFIDRHGEVVIRPFGCKSCYSFNDGLAEVYNRGWGYVDHWGTVVIL